MNGTSSRKTTSKDDVGVELKDSSSNNTGKKPHIRFDDNNMHHVNFCKRLHYSDPSRAAEGMYQGGEPAGGCCCIIS
jgi:hypothetical protein